MSNPDFYRFDAGGTPVTAAHPLPVTGTGGAGGAASATNPSPSYAPGFTYEPAAVSKARPGDTTPYTGATATTTGDLIADSTSAGSVSPYAFVIPSIFGSGQAEGVVDFVEVLTSWAFTGTIRAHLFQTTAPTVSAGDNSAIAVSNFSNDTYLGFVDLYVTPSPNGGAAGGSDSVRLPYGIAHNASLYGLLEAVTANTPTNAGAIAMKIKTFRTR